MNDDDSGLHLLSFAKRALSSFLALWRQPAHIPQSSHGPATDTLLHLKHHVDPMTHSTPLASLIPQSALSKPCPEHRYLAPSIHHRVREIPPHDSHIRQHIVAVPFSSPRFDPYGFLAVNRDIGCVFKGQVHATGAEVWADERSDALRECLPLSVRGSAVD